MAKFDLLEKLFLYTTAIIFDIINIILIIFAIGLIANTIINLFIGVILIVYLKFRKKPTEEGEGEGNQGINNIENQNQENIKKLSKNRKNKTGQEINHIGSKNSKDLVEDIATKKVEKKVEQEVEKKVVKKVVEKEAVKTVEKVGLRVVIGGFIAKLIPIINCIPIWTPMVYSVIKQANKTN